MRLVSPTSRVSCLLASAGCVWFMVGACGAGAQEPQLVTKLVATVNEQAEKLEKASSDRFQAGS